MKRTIVLTVTALLLVPSVAAQTQTQIENPEAAEKFNQGKALFEQGQYREALELLLDSARLEPGNYLACYMLGLTYKALRQPDDAIAQHRAAVNFNPNFYQAFFALGRVLYEDKNDQEGAIEAYKSSAEISERIGRPYARAWFNLGKIYFDQQKWPEAMEAYNQVAQIEPTNERAHNYMGRINLEMGQYETALLNFTMASQRQPTWYEPYFHKAAVLNKLAQWDQAIIAADEALKRMPNNGGSLYEKGMALKGKEQWDAATTVFEQAARDAQWRQMANYQIEVIKNRDSYVDIPPDPAKIPPIA